MNAYQQSLKIKRDNYNHDQYVLQQGLKQGIELERARAENEKKEIVRQTARNFKNIGLANEDIARGTGLSTAEIEAL